MAKSKAAVALLGLLAESKEYGVLPAHIPLILDGGTVLVSDPLLICAGIVYCHFEGCIPLKAVLEPLPWPLLRLNRSTDQ